MPSLNRVSKLAFSLLVALQLPTIFCAAMPAPKGLEVVPPEDDSLGPPSLPAYPLIIPGPPIREAYNKLMASRGWSMAYFFNETAQREFFDSEEQASRFPLLPRDDANDNAGSKLSKRWGLECLSVNRAPHVGVGACQFLLAQFHEELMLKVSTAGPTPLCTSVDKWGRRTEVFLVAGGPENSPSPDDPTTPKVVGSYARDVLNGFNQILNSCGCVPGTPADECSIGGTNAAAGNGMLGIWLIGEIP